MSEIDNVYVAHPDYDAIYSFGSKPDQTDIVKKEKEAKEEKKSSNLSTFR